MLPHVVLTPTQGTNAPRFVFYHRWGVRGTNRRLSSRPDPHITAVVSGLCYDECGCHFPRAPVTVGLAAWRRLRCYKYTSEFGLEDGIGDLRPPHPAMESPLAPFLPLFFSSFFCREKKSSEIPNRRMAHSSPFPRPSL